MSHRTSAAAPVSHQPAVEHGCVGGRGARPQRLCLESRVSTMIFHFLQSDDEPHTESLCGQCSLWSTAPYYGCMNLFTYHQLPTCLGQCMAPSHKWSTNQAGSCPKSGNWVYWWIKLNSFSIQPRLSCSTSETLGILRAIRGQPFQVRGILQSRWKTQRAKIVLVTWLKRVGGISAPPPSWEVYGSNSQNHWIDVVLDALYITALQTQRDP